MTDVTRDGGVLDGFHIGYVPDGVGDEVSDFASEWEDVHFATRVWERQTPDGYRADLRVHVLRGARLADLAGLRDFLTEYHERDPDEWQLTEFQHGDGSGMMSDAQAFWLAGPAVAVNVLIDPEQVDREALLAVARAIVPQGE
ncbi:hypothetical protein C1I95_26540 [Micromonospora craterilacus]|uniref:Uncharacterized protein n=1 Tax=Micromonospora craterilacus TaxID=1655439 RepID=A0A2W2F8W7_9ACTN|nr:hypothetical protein [Micromonospora craterilacus]PZG12124.1 hypothetical protein C1I95_26540 [Micromonospora craterilacus]